MLTSIPNYTVSGKHVGEKSKEKNKVGISEDDILDFFSKSLYRLRHVNKIVLKALREYVMKDMEEAGEADERLNSGLTGNGELLHTALFKVYSKNNPDISLINQDVWSDFFKKIFETCTDKEKPVINVFWAEFNKYFK